MNNPRKAPLERAEDLKRGLLPHLSRAILLAKTLQGRSCTCCGQSAACVVGEHYLCARCARRVDEKRHGG